MQTSQNETHPGADAPLDIPGQVANDPGHAHHWKIAPQGEANSVGRCECGAERTFANSYNSDPHGYRGRAQAASAPGRDRRG